MDASQYKDYVLTLLFMKYVSDKYAGDDEFADITVPPGGSFADMVALKGTKEIGDRINKVIGRLADANDHLLKGVIDLPDFNDETKLGKGKEMQDRLTKLVGIFEGLDFRANRAHGDDLLGDAYEYLMRHFATQSGKGAREETPTAFDRRCIRPGSLRSSLLLGRIALLFPFRRALPARRLAGLGARAGLSTGPRARGSSTPRRRCPASWPG